MENLKLSHGSLFLLPSDTTYLSGLASQTWGLLTSAHFCSLHSSINPALLLGYLLSLRHVTSSCHPHFLTLFCSAWKVRFNPSPLSELGPPSVIPSQPLGHTAGSGQGPQVPYLLTVQRRPGTEQGLVNGSVAPGATCSEFGAPCQNLTCGFVNSFEASVKPSKWC